MLQVKGNEKLENHMVRLDLDRGFCDFLLDSRSDISVASSRMVKEHCLNDKNAVVRVSLQPAFGNNYIAKLVNVQAVMLQEGKSEDKNGLGLRNGVTIACAISDELNSPYGLLSIHDWKTLKEHNKGLIPELIHISNTNSQCNESHIN